MSFYQQKTEIKKNSYIYIIERNRLLPLKDINGPCMTVFQQKLAHTLFAKFNRTF